MVWKNQKIGIENPKIAKKALLTPTAPSLKMRFSKNTHKPDIFTIQNPMKRDDVSIPILKVGPGQDLETQLQKKSWRNPPKASQKWYLPSIPC